MKQHLVIVCGVLYPNPSPTGLCAARYASLLTDHFDVEFVAITANGKAEDAVYDGIPVHVLTTKRISLEHRLKGLPRRLVHLMGSAQIKFRITGSLSWYSEAAYQKLEELNEERTIDAILTVCSPFPAHIAGTRFKQKHPSVRFCAYTVDPFASKSRITPFFTKFEDLVKFEREVCKKTDCLYLSEEAYNTRQDIYRDVQNKIALPYLLPRLDKGECGRFDKEYLHCVYAGSFYKDIRNPEFMLKVFAALGEEQVKLHLYSSGCEEIVKGYAGLNLNIDAQGYVSQEELRNVYASCDILIGVGNAANDFLPSKTYEYLSLRRPIVFFNPKGYDNQVLQKYPHSLQISDDTPIDKAVAFFKDFVTQENGKTISEEELNDIYSTNTETNIRKILIKGLKK